MPVSVSPFGLLHRSDNYAYKGKIIQMPSNLRKPPNV